jgi:hypothetical protein
MEKTAAQLTDPQTGWIVDPTTGQQTPPYAAYGKELANSAMLGAGVTGGATALYHLINGFNSAQLPELVRNEAPAAAKAVAKKKPRKSVKRAADEQSQSLTDRIMTPLGKLIPSGYVPGALPAGSAGPASLSAPHMGWRWTANAAATGAGALGGLALVQNLATKKKKKDLEAEVDLARQQYFDALHGKRAAALDAVYEKQASDFDAAYRGELAQNGKQDDWLNTAMRVSQPIRDIMAGTNTAGAVSDIGNTLAGTRAPGENRPATGAYEQGLGTLWGGMTGAALGTGTLGAIYMYNQTKARSKAENLQRAQAARARLQSLQQTPWVDPDELAALAK